MNNSTVRKVLTYTTKLDRLAQFKAKKRGLSSVQAYIEYLIVKDVEDIMDEVDILEEKEVEAVGRAEKDFQKGRYVTIKPGEDIQGFLDKVIE